MRTFDLLHRFAHQLPSLVISELLGVPADDRDRLTAWSDAVAPLLGARGRDDDRARAIAAPEEFHAYLGALLDERRRAPRRRPAVRAARGRGDGERLQRVELLSLAATLYSAGHRTTRDLFSNGMSVLLSSRERYRRVVEGALERRPNVVEEFLRFETPTLFVVARPARAVVDRAASRSARWRAVLVFLPAANRDPAAFDAPDEFRPGRRDATALSFAYGAHFCLGASLARAEARGHARGGRPALAAPRARRRPRRSAGISAVRFAGSTSWSSPRKAEPEVGEGGARVSRARSLPRLFSRARTVGTSDGEHCRESE